MFGRRFKERARSDPWISDRIRRIFSRRFTVGTNTPSGQPAVSLVNFKTYTAALIKQSSDTVHSQVRSFK